jgi:hypothetical protein
MAAVPTVPAAMVAAPMMSAATVVTSTAVMTATTMVAASASSATAPDKDVGAGRLHMAADVPDRRCAR